MLALVLGVIMDRILLIVIEDCAQAHGAFYKGRPVAVSGTLGPSRFARTRS
ncbi:DegT/DnrJ/EryC1/StrS family aminotransferase [Deinococcus cavernae]|uniref:DegT/DnrJ/EryC1/StrS family aminotransferase n=1 Tax=Deinococcus cavernae TaxID=2320857 RepID=UPI003B75B858